MRPELKSIKRQAEKLEAQRAGLSSFAGMIHNAVVSPPPVFSDSWLTRDDFLAYLHGRADPTIRSLNNQVNALRNNLRDLRSREPAAAEPKVRTPRQLKKKAFKKELRNLQSRQEAIASFLNNPPWGNTHHLRRWQHYSEAPNIEAGINQTVSRLDNQINNLRANLQDLKRQNQAAATTPQPIDPEAFRQRNTPLSFTRADKSPIVLPSEDFVSREKAAEIYNKTASLGYNTLAQEKLLNYMNNAGQSFPPVREVTELVNRYNKMISSRFGDKPSKVKLWDTHSGAPIAPMSRNPIAALVHRLPQILRTPAPPVPIPQTSRRRGWLIDG
jgi:hypothetical protein